MADICFRCGESWFEEDREFCANRRCRSANWDKPRREYRLCPADGVSFEVETGSRRIYHDDLCYMRHFDTAARRKRKERQIEFNVVMPRETPSPDIQERRR